MNDYSLAKIANHTITERRAEADRARLAHASRAEAASGHRNSRTPRQDGPRFALGTLLHRVSFF